MIRQVISCDICGTQMENSNHWFVAFHRGEELRIGRWNARTPLRKDARHLCGQTCLHKLVDEIMARARPLAEAHITSKPAPHVVAPRTDEYESSARIITPIEPEVAARTLHTWRTEAWKRERARERRSIA